MNTRLTDVLHDRADQLSPPLVDLDAVVATGSRRVRRRRALAGAGVATATAAVLVGGVVLQGFGPGQPTQVQRQSFAAAFAERAPAYAVGQDVHIDGRHFSVPTQVHALVQTTHGVVYSDRDGDVWSADGDTAPTKVGRIDPDEPRLAADGSSVAWAEVRDGDAHVALLDQSDGEVTTAPATGDDHRVKVNALDGTTVYGHDDRGVVRWDAASSTSTVLSASSDDVEIVDVEDGLIAYLAPTDPASEEMVSRATRTYGEGRELQARSMLGLSEDGARVLGETAPDVFALFDVTSGRHENITVPGYEFVVGYRWLDADTYLMIGMNPPYDDAPVDILECEVGGGCAVAVAEAGRFDNGLVLSFGEPMDS